MTTEFGSGIAKAENSSKAGKKAAEEALEKMDTEEVDFAVVYSSPEYDYEEVLEAVKQATGAEKMIGASSSGEFTEEETLGQSVSVGLISSDRMKFFTSLATGISDDVMGTVQKAAEDLPEEVEGYPHMAGINLHDGLAGAGESISLTAQNALGGIAFGGGSAGDDAQLEETQVFEGTTAETDAVALAVIASKDRIPVAVNHGHEPISGEFEVTEADGNVVKELDGENAFEVWKDAIREKAEEEMGIDVDEVTPEDDEFATLLTRYEFGLKIDDDNYKVRWPGLTSSTDELTFAVNIPEGVKVKVMHSPEEKQIESAKKTAEEAVEMSDSEEFAGALEWDCICRGMILGDRFSEAIDQMRETIDAPIAGFETYGEVCMREGDMSGYHNTTSVVMLFPDN